MSVNQKKWFLTGASGLLGQVFLCQLAKTGVPIYALTREHILFHKAGNVRQVKGDLMQKDNIARVLDDLRPDIIVHMAGLTSVDECEKNPEFAFNLNTEVPARLARWSADNAAKYVFISSDHVTDGTTPHFDETSPLSPVNVYARTKVEAEKQVLANNDDSLLLRTNFFAKGFEWRKSLTDWIWEKAVNNETIPAFTDSYFSPLSAHYLSEIIISLVEKEQSGLFHAGGSERLSKYEFAMAFVKYFDLDQSLVKPVKTVDAHLAAPRPADMSMSVDKIEKALGKKMPTIKESFKSIENSYRNVK